MYQNDEHLKVVKTKNRIECFVVDRYSFGNLVIDPRSVFILNQPLYPGRLPLPVDLSHFLFRHQHIRKKFYTRTRVGSSIPPHLTISCNASTIQIIPSVSRPQYASRFLRIRFCSVSSISSPYSSPNAMERNSRLAVLPSEISRS